MMYHAIYTCVVLGLHVPAAIVLSEQFGSLKPAVNEPYMMAERTYEAITSESGSVVFLCLFRVKYRVTAYWEASTSREAMSMRDMTLYDFML